MMGLRMDEALAKIAGLVATAGEMSGSSAEEKVSMSATTEYGIQATIKAQIMAPTITVTRFWALALALFGKTVARSFDCGVYKS